MLQEGWNSIPCMLFITITSPFAGLFVLLQIMRTEELYKKKINALMLKRGSTVFHITGIRHGDYKEEASAFIEKAAKTMLSVCFFQEKTNQYDHEAVSCRHGRSKIGYVATYDLEKYYILVEKNDTDHLTGHFGHFSANVEDHLLKLYMPDTITLDDIYEYRRKIDKRKDELYGSWKHDAIDYYLVYSRHQEDAIACISQLKEHVVQLFGGSYCYVREEIMPYLKDYKDCSQYDISLEGQRDRWDILLYLDFIHDFHHQPGQFRDEFYEGKLKDAEEILSQIAGELVRSVSYKAYIERLSELVTKHLPSSEAAQHYLHTLPSEAFNNIRQQVENFPHHLYHLFHTNPEEFVRTIYYARIPRKYLDPFLSGIALMEAYNRRQSSNIFVGQPNETTMIGSSNTTDHQHFSINETVAHKMYKAVNVVKWLPATVDEDEWMFRLAGKLPKDPKWKASNNAILFKGLNQIYYIAKNWIYSPECNMTQEQWDLVRVIFRAKKGDIKNVNLRCKSPKGFETFEKEMKKKEE